MRDNIGAFAVGGGLLVLFVLVIVVLGAFITMWAWNTVMPYLFNLPEITFIQAVAINLLLGAIGRVCSHTTKRES